MTDATLSGGGSNTANTGSDVIGEDTKDSLKQKATAAADQLQQKATAAADQFRSTVTERASVARDWATDQGDVLRDTVQTRPFISVGVSAGAAFAAGLVLGILLTRR